MLDHLLITAPDPRLASAFEGLIARRIRSGLYPREIAFHVVADPPGRVGSGGATLLALRHLLDKLDASADEFFANNRVVLLHAGGESRRLPMYAPEGKLLAPIPLATSALDPPVLLDLHIGSFLNYPWQESSGTRPQGEVVVASGDALLQFDPESIPARTPGVRGIAVPASFETGSRHGVFQLDPDTGEVIDFHQKKNPEYLAKHAAIDDEHCAMDSGLFAFDPASTIALLSIADATTEGKRLGDALSAGDISIDLYREIVLACVARNSAEDLARRLGPSCTHSPVAIDAIHEVMRWHPLTAAMPADCLFRHLGTIADYREACAEMRHMRAFYSGGPAEIPATSSPELTAFNIASDTVLPSKSPGSLIENCDCKRLSLAGGPNFIVGVRNPLPTPPPGICIDQRRLSAHATLTLIYGESDSHKPIAGLDDTIFCGVFLSQWLQQRGLDAHDIRVTDEPIDLHELFLFVPNAPLRMLAGYWTPPDDPVAWGHWFRDSIRMSLLDAHEYSDPIARDEERREIRRKLLRESLLVGDGWRNASGPDIRQSTDAQTRRTLKRRIKSTDDPLLAQYRRQTLARPSIKSRASTAPLPTVTTPHAPASNWTSRRWSIGEGGQIIARAPVRLDLAGGWSDTPPYTNRFGGHVVNVAVDLNGRPPIEVRVRRVAEPVIAVRSIDGRTEGVFRSLDEIEGFDDPARPHSLQRAALFLAGIRAGALQGKSLASILAIAGGVEITTDTSLPTGNGMGTSSILGAAVLAALHRAMGIELDQPALIALVLELERILTTGGGWQDQVGGIVGGVKSTTTRADRSPDPTIERLPADLFTNPRHTERTTLYYTGITRMAKSILQDVVAQVNDATPAYLFTIHDIRRHASLARAALVANDLDALASVLNLTWRAKRLIHPSTTNPELDDLLNATRRLWTGAAVLGAGGGGFILFVSRDSTDADSLQHILDERPAPDGAAIYDMSLNERGLTIKGL